MQASSDFDAVVRRQGAQIGHRAIEIRGHVREGDEFQFGTRWFVFQVRQVDDVLMGVIEYFEHGGVACEREKIQQCRALVRHAGQGVDDGVTECTGVVHRGFVSVLRNVGMGSKAEVNVF